MKIWLIHGFRVSDSGAGTIGKLQPDLERYGLEVEIMGYPWTHLLTLTWVNRAATKKLLEKCGPNDGIITHSNGAAIAMDAVDMGLQCVWVGHVNPALNSRRLIPPKAPPIDVWYNQGDYIGGLAKGWRRITRFFPWRWQNPHDWGAMGQVGYRGNDPRVVNHELSWRLRHSGALHDPLTRDLIAATAARRVKRGGEPFVLTSMGESNESKDPG